MSSFALYRPTKSKHTKSSRPDAMPTSSSNPFVAGGVRIVKPVKDSVAEQDGECTTQLVQLRDCRNPCDTNACATGTPQYCFPPEALGSCKLWRPQQSACSIHGVFFYGIHGGKVGVSTKKSVCVCHYRVNPYHDLGV